jgi:hypothetical protein
LGWFLSSACKRDTFSKRLWGWRCFLGSYMAFRFTHNSIFSPTFAVTQKPCLFFQYDLKKKEFQRNQYPGTYPISLLINYSQDGGDAAALFFMDYQAFESTIHQWAKETKRYPYNRGFWEGTLHIYSVDDGLAYFVFQSPGHQTAIPVGRCSRHMLRAVTTFRQRVVLRRSHTSQRQTTVYIHSQLLRFIWHIYSLFPVFLFLFFSPTALLTS